MQPDEKLEWTKEDTAFIETIRGNSTGSKKTSLKELIKLHKSLNY